MLKNTILFLGLLYSSIHSSYSYAREVLLVIKSVSKSKDSFAIRRGYKDGIKQGQISLFSTDKASFSARVSSISRYYSTWKLQEEEAKIPFKKGQIVNYTNSIERIWTRVGMLKFLAQKKEVEFKRLKKSKHFDRFIISGSFSNALSDNVKEIEDYEPLQRQAFTIEASYLRKISPLLEVGGGVRFDQETATKDDPQFSIPTTRYLVQAFLIRNFEMNAITHNQLYIGTGFGFGKSTSNVLEDIKTGTSYLFPTFKFGRKFSTLATYSVFAEVNLEYINSIEAFEDGEAQTTRVLAARFAFGIAF